LTKCNGISLGLLKSLLKANR